MSAVNNRKAFTLVELIVILAVIGILAGLAVPAALRLFEITAEEATRQEMDNIKRAILGDARKLQSSFRSDFGYIGDIGCVPDDLRRILFNPPPLPPVIPALPTWTFDTTKQTGAGWKGPYITGAATGQEVEEFTKDQWGNDYAYAVPAAPPTCRLTATLTSTGADLASASDDIIITIAATDTAATTVRGTVKDTAGNLLEAVPVEFYSAVDGALPATPPTANTDANGNYSFLSVPFGPRAVRALPRLVYSPGSVSTGGGGQDIQFTVVNYSTSAITITQIQAVFGPLLATNPNYDQIQINNVTVDNANNFRSGDTPSTTNCPGGNPSCNVVAASPATRPSMRVSVDSTDVQLPDITISGQGTAAIIELNNFNQDMGGTPFTVTFNPGANQSVVKFTP